MKNFPSQKVCRTGVAILISIIAFLNLFQVGKTLGMDKEIHLRHQFYSVPAAVSFIKFGTHDYTINSDLYNIISQNAKDLNVGIKAAINASVDRDKFFLLPADDKGNIDFAIGSFVVFGPQIESMYMGFFLLLALSSTLFYFQFKKNDSKLVFLPLFLLSLNTISYALPVTKELYSFHNPRVFGVLTVLPILHLCFLIDEIKRPKFWLLVGASLQATLLTFCIHVRSAEKWVFVPLSVYFLIKIIKVRKIFLIWPICLLIISTLIFDFYAKNVYHPEYFKSKGKSHLTWHNVGIGFALHPKLAAEYQLSIDDAPMINLVTRTAYSIGGSDFVSSIFTPELASFESHGIAHNYSLYERVARNAVLNIAKNNKQAFLELHFYYKPVTFLKNFLWMTGNYQDNYVDLNLSGQIGSITDKSTREREGLQLKFLRIESILGVSAIALAFAKTNLKSENRITLLVASSSLLPTFLAYPLVHLIAVPATLLILTLYLITFSLTQFLASSFLKHCKF